MKQLIKTAEIEQNIGQLTGLHENPRIIRKEQFQKLCDSMRQDCRLLEHRGLLVYPHNGKYIAIGGNMRLKACKEIGLSEIWCEVLPNETPIETLNRYILIDNAGFGEWDVDLLANQYDTDLLQSVCLDYLMPKGLSDSVSDSVSEHDTTDEEKQNDGEVFSLLVIGKNQHELDELSAELASRGFMCQ